MLLGLHFPGLICSEWLSFAAKVRCTEIQSETWYSWQTELRVAMIAHGLHWIYTEKAHWKSHLYFLRAMVLNFKFQHCCIFWWTKSTLLNRWIYSSCKELYANESDFIKYIKVVEQWNISHISGKTQSPPTLDLRWTKSICCTSYFLQFCSIIIYFCFQ